MQRVTPVFRWGFIGPSRPGPVHVGAGYRFYQIVPTNVMLVSTGLVGLDDYTKDGVDRAIQSYWECVDLLAKQKVDVIILGGAFSGQDYVGLEMALHNGDVITAPARQYVTVEGEVQRPGRYAIEGDLTITGAISTAGGLTRFGSSDVKLRRIDPATAKVTITKVDLKDVRKGSAPDPAVAPNDVITVSRRLF